MPCQSVPSRATAAAEVMMRVLRHAHLARFACPTVGVA